MVSEHIAQSIRNRRKELGITQPDLAELAQMSVNTLVKIERGQANPTLEILDKVLNVLGLCLRVEVPKH